MAVTASGSTFRMKWHGPKLTRRIEGILSRRLDQAAELVKAQTIRNLRKNQSWIGKGRRPKGKAKWKAIRDYYAGKPSPYSPSKPGEIPHVDGGQLSMSIFWDRRSKLVRRVGTPLEYGLWLQVGTRKMKARAYLDVTLSENLSKVRAIVTAPIK